ncbi:hypothetical protein FOB58_003210 [Candida parapsilosis]|uniref:DUF3835 domain-containing protein n=2 Tax=Candida parapsilosis TaxID=5480 RepID=G8B6P0_CANPC|nr:uncharacterized protein CPAR2_101600 [Candida parapsilosis]KAF6048100.1 hypothetical protein FOB59_003143 [Candida parapsilosis]KAF6049933.1 hypothetical protein FOB58_003210 [Candida parapsilosis]KAF6057796.1 hypothetical protein FOB60_002351 [Candida parapsilosis]KAF6065497.1 hypothetical protein FOB61_001567 [Candida parapsilosis]KAI5903364.1 Bud site selection protein 27 [Candida parapsilosis]
MSTTIAKGTAPKDEKSEINELIKQINLTILNLQRKRLHLSRELSVALKQKTPKIEEVKDERSNEETSRSESNDDKAIRLKSLVEQFDQKIKEAQSTKDNLNKLGQQLQSVNHVDEKEKLNEDGLPFMDIQEEVDEDGNFISSRINNVPVEVEGPVTKSASKVITPSSSGKSEKASKVGDISPGQTNGDSQDDELMQLFADMELMPGQTQLKQHLNQDELLDKIDDLKISPEEKFNLKKICVQAFEDYNENDDETKKQTTSSSKKEHSTPSNKTTMEKSSIDTDNLLELELLADEFDNEEDAGGEYADDEDWDYELDDDGDDDGDDDDENDDDRADDLLYGTKPNSTWLGGKSGDPKSSDLFWNQIAELRRKETSIKGGQKHGLDASESEVVETKPIDAKKKQKSVRFAENLDIKNVENISDSLKTSPPFIKTSLFKQNRVNGTSRNNGGSAQDAVSEKESIVEDIVVERDVDVPSSDKVVEDTIMEKDINDSPNSTKPSRTFDSDTQQTIKKPVSRFKALRKNTPPSDIEMHSSKANNDGLLENPMQMDDSQSVSITSNAEMHQNEVGTKPDHYDESMVANDTHLDYSNMQDMDTMAKAYLMGMYDDDIDIDGPLVESLEDFKSLNKIVESKSREKSNSVSTNSQNARGGEVYDQKSNEIGMDYDENHDIDDYDENEAMINDIEEHGLDEDDTNLHDENDITNQELSESYNKLRERMLARENAKREEQGFERTDEEGNVIRVSKFKARMNK